MSLLQNFLEFLSAGGGTGGVGGVPTGPGGTPALNPADPRATMGGLSAPAGGMGPPTLAQDVSAPVGGMGPPTLEQDQAAPVPAPAPPEAPPSFSERFSSAIQSPTFQLGANLLANSGPSVVPRGFGEILGTSANQTLKQQNAQALQQAQIDLIRSRIGVNESMAGAGTNPTAGNVQSTFKGQNGNMFIVTRDGQITDSGIPFSTNVRLFEQDDGSVEAIDSTTGERLGSPVTPEEAQAAQERRASTNRKIEATGDLPQEEDRARVNLDILDRLENHPGFSSAVGVQGPSTGFGAFDSAIPGTDEADFLALIDQVGGSAFLQAFQELKGGGHITEIEGLKAEQAISRLRNRSQTEESYRQAIDDLRGVINDGLRRKREAAGQEGSNVINFSDLPPGN